MYLTCLHVASVQSSARDHPVSGRERHGAQPEFKGHDGHPEPDPDRRGGGSGECRAILEVKVHIVIERCPYRIEMAFMCGSTFSLAVAR